MPYLQLVDLQLSPEDGWLWEFISCETGISQAVLFINYSETCHIIQHILLLLHCYVVHSDYNESIILHPYKVIHYIQPCFVYILKINSCWE